MKKILMVLFSRGFVIGLSAAVMLSFWAVIFTVFGAHRNFILDCMTVISAICVLHLVVKDIDPEHKIAWIMFMLILPPAGGVFYLFSLDHRASKKTRLFHEEIQKALTQAVHQVPKLDVTHLSDRHAIRQLRYLEDIAKGPAFENTRVTYFPLGETMQETLLRELKLAKKCIFIETFIIEEGKMWGEIEEILIQKAEAGVDVRVLYDDLGCILTLSGRFAKRLRSYGIHCHPFNRINHVFNVKFNYRDHRKICVIDGNVGFNGGINFADEYINHKMKYGHWKDTAVMLKGEGVYGLTLLFLSMWAMETGVLEVYSAFAPTIQFTGDGIVQPFGDAPLDDDSVGESIYMSILNNAKDYVYITTPYLIITREMALALSNAAKSGIDVRLILPGIPDKKFVHFLSRSYYGSLVKAGVKIYEYLPGFIHSKMFISDDNTAIVGTINLDYRSLDLHYECGTMLYDCPVIDDIKTDFLQTQSKCVEITHELIKIHSKPTVAKFFVLSVLRSFSPLL